MFYYMIAGDCEGALLAKGPEGSKPDLRALYYLVYLRHFSHPPQMTNLRRCLRSADTSAESSGKQQQATSGETAAGPLRCATSTSAPRTRPKRVRIVRRSENAANCSSPYPVHQRQP